MFKTIEGAVNCEIRSVIRFLNVRNVLPSEIHHQICQVYDDNASVMAANMWKNSLKNVESDNNKILYENVLDFFYRETVLTFWIRLVLVS